MVSKVIADLKDNLEAILSSFREELSKIRTGRITSVVVEDIPVEVYGTRMTIKELATIRIPEPLQILIELWDKNILGNVERALILADLGVSPVVGEGIIRLNFPPLTLEGRERLVKLVKERVEEARLRIRRARQEVRSEVESFRDSEGEDFVFRLEKEIDRLVTEAGDRIEEIKKKKEEEIRG